MKNAVPVTEPSFLSGAISAEQIETINLKRMIYTCICAMGIQLINLLNPDFWEQPILWGGSVYLVVFSVTFLFLAHRVSQKKTEKNLRLLHTAFWSLLTLGVFPFLVRDAGGADMPINCVILCTVLICAPLLQVKELKVIFTVSGVMNFAAALYAGNTSAHYYLEIASITAVGFFFANNLHGRYFALLEQQRRQYDAYLAAAEEQQALQLNLEKERAASAAKNEFLNRMSHDLRTPLSGVIGMANLALEPEADEKTRLRYLHEIALSGSYLLSLINDVLDMSKIESSKLTLHPECYRLDEFMETVNSVMEEPCREKNLRFRVVVPPDNNVVCTSLDRMRFNQIFVNLLSNAAKFTPPGGAVDLVIEHLWQKGSRICERFTVRDTGIGMSAEFLPHAFDTFAQERDNDGTQGTGLGLSIVKKLVDLMDGTIRIESSPGCGTSVIVEMEMELAEPPAAGCGEDPAWGCGLRGKKILVCEDNNVNAEIVTALLEREGAAVVRCQNGQEGVDAFCASAPGEYSAVLMDVRMPVLDGLGAARAIRSMARPDAPEIPIIALTANTFEEDKEACFLAGMNDHVAKPIEPKKLYGALAKALRKTPEEN